jgi:hypothetical protein
MAEETLLAPGMLRRLRVFATGTVALHAGCVRGDGAMYCIIRRGFGGPFAAAQCQQYDHRNNHGQENGVLFTRLPFDLSKHKSRFSCGRMLALRNFLQRMRVVATQSPSIVQETLLKPYFMQEFPHLHQGARKKPAIRRASIMRHTGSKSL